MTIIATHFQLRISTILQSRIHTKHLSQFAPSNLRAVLRFAHNPETGVFIYISPLPVLILVDREVGSGRSKIFFNHATAVPSLD
jgi:hypothetical protein